MHKSFSVWWWALLAASSAGCQAGSKPLVELPPDVRKLAVGSFTAAQADHGKWAEEARRMSRQRLSDLARRRRRFSVLPPGKPHASADAVVTGQVTVLTRQRRASGEQGKPAGSLACTAAITFTITRPKGGTLVSQRLSRIFDSSGQGTPDVDKIIAGLLGQCVNEFTAGLFPRPRGKP